MRLLKNNPTRKSGATVAQVSFSESGSFGAVSATEQRGIPVFGPRGVAYRPCEGDNLLVLPADGTEVCAGVLCRSEGLAAGELRLSSSGGASIWLKQSGDVVINDVTITKSGQIIAP